MSTLALLVPARDAERVLGRLLESAAAQTRRFDEVLVYDDASSDKTAEVARRYGARVLRADVNTGPSAGKNRLATMTSCEWLHFHDADEVLGPEFVERAHDWMRQPDVDVVIFKTEDRDDPTGRYLGQAMWDDEEVSADAVRYCIVHTVTNCGIYRRAPFLEAGGFDLADAVKYNEDQAMHLRLALGGLRFRAEMYRGVIVYRRPNSMSSGHPIECARAQVEVLDRAAERTGTKYASEIGERLWRLAGVCGGHADWDYVAKALSIARRVEYRDPTGEHWMMRAMARVSPVGAVAVRERLIRWLKPHLRADMPTVSRTPASRGAGRRDVAPVQ